MQYKISKTFTFLDESGVFSPPSSGRKYYGIGILKHTNPISIIQKLHSNYEGLVSELKKDPTKVEFSFKYTTAKSLKYDLKFIDILEKDFDWEFNCLYFDANSNSKSYYKPLNPVAKWEKYIDLSKMLIKNNLWSSEETVLIADFQHKPILSRKNFEVISLDVPQVYNVLQTESHGVLLIQAVDLLLGGFLYSLNPEAGDKEGNKIKLSGRVLKLQNKVGRKKFNCWEVNWDLSKT